MAYTLKINESYIKSTALDITGIVDEYLRRTDVEENELIIYSDNKYRSRGPLLDLSVIESKYTVIELTGISPYNIEGLHDSVSVLDIDEGSEYVDAAVILDSLPTDNMTELSLTYYRLVGTIPPTIEDFSLLLILDLSRNELKGILSIYLPNLRELYLDYNMIEAIADPFYDMDSLEILSMKYNRLRRDPTSRLNEMQNLHTVELQGNPFSRRRSVINA